MPPTAPLPLLANRVVRNTSILLKPTAIRRALSYSHYIYNSNKLTHTDAAGKAHMVDVGDKRITKRVAVAQSRITLGQEAFQLVEENKMKKGDVLTVAQLAGISAAKQTSSLIPLCHNIPLNNVKVDLTLEPHSHSVLIQGKASCTSATGVEMEALTAVSVAALTVYDMCKAVSHNMAISDIQLLEKTGGKKDVYLNK